MKKIHVVVKKGFLDRYTGKRHNPGDKIAVTPDRLREIKRSGDYVTVETPVIEPKK